MEDKELSQWFDINVQKPWEPGVYEVEIDSMNGKPWKRGSPLYAFFEKDFSLACGTPSYAHHRKHIAESLLLTVVRWRGLASDPSAKPKPKVNRKVTRYVVRSYDKQKVFASFENVDNARLYADGINEPVRITKIRFRTPEA